MVNFLSGEPMKILVNGYRAKRNKKVFYGGTRNFNNLMVREFNRLGHSVISLNIHGKKRVDDRFLLLQETKGKNPAWFLKLRLNLSDIYKAKQGKIPDSLQQPLEIIKEVIKELNPDVVMLNGLSIINWFILRAAADLKLPVVVVHHGLWFKEFNNVFSDMSSATEKILREMEIDVTRFASRQVFLNKFSQEVFAKNLIKPRLGRSLVIPLPYNPVFAKGKGKVLKPNFFKTDKIKVGVVSRWDPVKAPEKFLLFAREARRQKMPLEFYAVVKIKDKHQRLEKYKKAFIKEIHLIPQLPQEELPEFYRQVDVLLLPSNFDVSPTVVMEAALVGRMTAISPNVGWVSEYKELKLGDWIIDFNNPKTATRKFMSLISQSNLSSAKFVQHIKEKHSPKQVFTAYDKLFRRLIK